MNFSALESRLNASVIKHLANTMVLFDGAVDPVPGDFRKPYDHSEAGLGMAGAAPAVRIADAAVPPDADGIRLVINGVSYTVSRVEPDGTGLTLLVLETAL